MAENPTSTNLEGWGDQARRLNQFPDATEIGAQSDQVPVNRLRIRPLEYIPAWELAGAGMR